MVHVPVEKESLVGVDGVERVGGRLRLRPQRQRVRELKVLAGILTEGEVRSIKEEVCTEDAYRGWGGGREGGGGIEGGKEMR